MQKTCVALQEKQFRVQLLLCWWQRWRRLQPLALLVLGWRLVCQRAVRPSGPPALVWLLVRWYPRGASAAVAACGSAAAGLGAVAAAAAAAAADAAASAAAADAAANAAAADAAAAALGDPVRRLGGRPLVLGGWGLQLPGI